MKKHFLLLIIIFLFLSAVYIGASGNPVDLYDSKGGRANSNLDAAHSVQFATIGKFDSIDIYIASITNTDISLRVSLYEWKDTYQESLEKEPIISKTISEGLVKRKWFTWDLKDQVDKLADEGEYILHLEQEGKGTLALTIYDESLANVRTYEAYIERKGEIQMTINFVDKAGKLKDISPNFQDLYVDFDRYVATDGLGRSLASYKEAGGPREGKYVGIFFHTWHDWNASRGSRNITEILNEHPDIVNDFKSPYWGNAPVYHWNEPVYNYYKNTDRWVLRKQAELLADAGIDVIIFDNTNGATTYSSVVEVIFEVFAQARKDGVKTPQISFLMNFWDFNSTNSQLIELYNTFYKDGRYQDLWFYWKGKPLMMASSEELDASIPLQKEIADFFTFRPGQPSYTAGQEKQGQWGWLSVYPQQVYTNEDGTPEQISVGIAQNHNKARGLTAFNGEDIFGRTYSGKTGTYDKRENAKLYGKNFEEQFEYALEVDPEFIFITGWNEWVVSRYETWLGVENAFPDSFNDEYSRDIEPSLGDLKDHYYYQMVNYIRLFKGVKAPFEVSDQKTIDIFSKTDQWEDVFPYFKAYKGNTFNRDSEGYVNNETGRRYEYYNNTGRNDIVGAKLARDNEYVYFMVECANVISSADSENWMRLFIDIEGSKEKDWETFNFVVKRVNPTDNKAYLERSLGGWEWETLEIIDFSLDGKRLQIRIPKKALGIKSDAMTINFKWVDNSQEDGDIMDFYVNGDAAPIGRFKYQYTTNSLKEKGKFPWIIVAPIAIVVLAAVVGSMVFFGKKRKVND